MERWDYREPVDPTAKEVKKKINTTGLDDNCYYVVAAKLSGTDVNTLIGKTEEMQIKGGASPKEVEKLFTAAGLTGVWSEYTSMDKVEEGIQPEDTGALPVEYALLVTWKSSGGHAIVLHFDGDETYKYMDYQPTPPKQWSKKELDTLANRFFVFKRS